MNSYKTNDDRLATELEQDEDEDIDIDRNMKTKMLPKKAVA